MNAFLDDADLYRLTGYIKPSKQIEWLERNGIPHTVNARGRPAVRLDMDKSAVHALELGPVR